jgi:protein CpxP
MPSFSPTLALGAILLTSFSGVSLLAQDQQQPPASTSQAAPLTQPRHAPNPQRHAKKMARKLGLTPDQEARLEPILADKQQQMESAKADTTLAPKDKRAKVRSINQDSDAKVEAIMNDSQKQQYQQMKQTRRADKQQQSAASTNS